jgi:hypothetical protein
MKKNKFDELSRESLVQRCLELEDENAKLRPQPPRFKMGQLVAYVGTKNPWQRGQPAIYFTVLSIEQRSSEWYYGNSMDSPGPFTTFPERKCRALSEVELNGTTEAAGVGLIAGEPMNNTPIPIPAGGTY